ncbi:response regulator transcription factor [Paenibacillus monticola]|uniref:Helix-turn-helix domain-containing protein n=1 Tax=Paenibacillus monticola TaxID=2666075 RepID=A0A7X2H535_9BACL|nr:helix-turn-helix domain-containing protein [Paenibacillus monticola]MRN52878.1 helix-turn-helix domain-containing protein [Paenibacillus monticola]
MFEIMLVDAEKGERNSIKTKIDWESAGFTIVSEAASGSEALKLLKRGPLPQVVISDIRMPLMEGVEFIRTCKQKYPFLRFVVLSGYSDFDYLKAAIQLGVKDYLLKPVARGELNELLGKLGEDIKAEPEHIKASQLDLLRKNEQLCLLQENYLLQMVKDEWYSVAVVKKRLQQLQLTPLTADNLVMQFVAMEMKIPEGRMIDWQERRDLLNLAYQRLCRETAAQWKGLYPFRDMSNSSMMYFLLIVKKGAEHHGKAERFVQELKRKISSYLKLESVAGIGGEMKGLKRLKNAYASCMLSWSQSTVDKIESVDQNQVRELALVFSPEAERKLVQAIENLDRNTFRSQLDVIFTGNRDTPMLAFTFLALRMLLLFSSIVTKFEWAGSALQKYLWNCQMTISDYQSREGMLGLIEELAQLVMEEVKTTRFSNGQHIVEAVRQYVEENFSYELTLSFLADRFHLNETYLSGLFKQHVGITFSDYVTRLRITKAEQLLQESELKQSDIAMLVGYSSTSYFSTSFKNYCGKSPKEYRESILKKQGL